MVHVQKVQHKYTSDGSYTDEAVVTRWWTVEKSQVHKHIFPIVKAIRTRQALRHDLNLVYARLYSNQDLLGLSPWDYATLKNHTKFDGVTLNVIKSCVDTAASKIGKAKPRPIFLTSDGNWSKKQRAKKLTKFMDGWFEESKIYQTGRRAFVDGSVFGTGGVKLFKQGGKLKAERVLSDEIIVDDAEAMYGYPRQLHQLKVYHREVLLEFFPGNDARAAIDASKPFLLNKPQGHATDLVEVVESWHLASGDEANDGLHTISVANGTLFHEEWKKSYFPFAFFRWSQKLVGFYGSGIPEEIVGVQLEINKLLKNIQKAMHLVAVPQVWLNAGDHAATTQAITNETAGRYYYAIQPPVYITPPVMPPEVYQHLERLYQKAFEIVGISQLSAGAQKPAGITADVALRTMQDIESQRFMMTVLDYEDFYMNITDIAVDQMEDLAKEGSSPWVHAKEKSVLHKLSWKDVRLDREEYITDRFPTSALPQDPSGRTQKVQEWVQAGFVGQEDALELLDFPDTERYKSLRVAAREINSMYIDGMLDGGDYQPPEPYMNIALAKEQAQQSYLKAKIDGCPDEDLEKIRIFISDCDAMLNPAPAPSIGAQPNPMGVDPAAAVSEGAQPLAVPEQAPTSDLLPIGV